MDLLILPGGGGEARRHDGRRIADADEFRCLDSKMEAVVVVVLMMMMALRHGRRLLITVVGLAFALDDRRRCLHPSK